MAITKIEVPELFDFGSDNSAFKLPTGTTAERPTSPSNGEMRFNTTTGYVEYYDTTDTQWWEIDYEALCTTNDPNYPITNLAYYKMSDASDSGEGSGYIGQGGMFNGNGEIDTGIDLDTYDETWSISLWVKFIFNSSYRYIAGDLSASGALNGFTIDTSPTGQIRFRFRNSSTSVAAITSTNTYGDGDWHHIAAVKDSSNNYLYVDGVQVGTIATVNGISHTTNIILGRVGAYNGFYNGTLDQVRIYDTALSSSNVALLYAETSATSSTLNYPTGAGGIALYELSGNANDTGNTYNGAATNVEYAYNGTATNVNFNVAGKFGNAGEFNGSSSRIVTGVTPATGSGQFSVSGWVNVDSLSAIRGVFSTITTPGTDRLGFSVHVLTNGKVRALVYDSAGVGIIESTDLITAGTWHHIVFTYSNGLSKIYVDGDVQSSTVNQLITGYYDSINIGRYYASSASLTMLGKIDQVRIFSSALNASQVTQLYNEIQCVPTIVPTENFNTVLYTGDDTNTSYTRDITGVGFDPDFVWIKDRDNSGFEHALFDSVRGAGASKILSSDSTGAEGWTTAAPMSAFITDGFSVQPRSPWNANNLVNKNGEDFVAWNWKAGGAAVSNTDGTITSQVSANVDAGFSIVKWTGNDSASQTIGHGLSSTPELYIIKKTSAALAWQVNLSSLVTGTEGYLLLDRTLSMYTTFPNYYTSANNTVLSTNGTSTAERQYNNQSANYIAYAFHSVAGYSKMGSYVGGGTTDVPVNLGFRLAFVMVKASSASGNWTMYDNKRQTGTVPYENYTILLADDSYQEQADNTIRGIQFNSSGFILNQNYSLTNTSGVTYIFMAFAADPT